MAGIACGIVGLPNVGKSTLFNALTSSLVDASNYPFCTIDPNVGIVDVEDPRLSKLAELSKSARIVYATTQFVDIAGLVEGASRGEGLGNAFLSHIRETDAIIHVVRCFDEDGTIHVCGSVDPKRDIEIINMELVLSDLALCEASLGRLEKSAKNKKDQESLVDLLRRMQKHLAEGFPLRSMSLSHEESKDASQYRFLTMKKMLYVCNVGEDEQHNSYVEQVMHYAAKDGSQVMVLSARIESEIAQLAPEERKEFLSSLGMEASGLTRLIHMSFDMLGLMTFLTTGEMETRAWTISQGTRAVDAAAAIHSDIQRGFIRAEVVSFEDFVRYGGRVGAREAGKARVEGKEYIMQDGDVVLFLHNG